MSILVTPTVAAAPADVTTATTIDTSAFKLGANVLYTAVVYQRHTTPASMGTVTSVVGDLSGAWTPWPTNPTRTYGGASPTGRQTAYWFLSSADIAETKVRATLSAAQVGARLRVFAIGGTRVASPIVQCVAADSAGASVLTLATPPSFLGFADVRNGAIASLMVGAASALTPKINWTEVAETSAVTIDTDFQWIGVNDGTANVTASVAGPMSAIAAEIAAPPGAVTYSLAGGGAITTGAVGTGSGPFVYPSQSLAVRAGRISVLHWTGGNPAGPPTGTPVWSHSFSAGVTATQVYYHYDPNAGGENLATAIYHLTSTVDGANFQTIISGTTSSSLKETWQLHELGNVDVAVNVLGPGLVSRAHTESASPTAAFALSSLGFASRENFALLLSSQSTNSGTLGTTEAGWALNNGLAAGGNCAVQSMYRPNSPQSVTGTYSAHTTHVVVLEFAGLPVTHPPVATLVSPAPPTITQAASVTIDVTDDDGDLAGVAITANGEPVYTTAGGFVSPYTGSSTSGVTNGTRFVVTRTGGWLAGSLAINVLATDARAQSRAYSFLWSSVTVPTFHDPVWTVDSPPTPGSIGDTVPIVIEVNDVDNDIDFSTISIQIGEAHAFLGSAFQDPYDNTSTVVATAHGWKFTILQDGGVWTGDDVGAYCTASDTHGGEGHALFIWTPVVHPSANDPVVALVSPSPGPLPPTDAIIVDVTDVDDDLASVLAFLDFTSEVVYSGAPDTGSFSANFAALSTKTTLTHGVRLTIRRSGGLPTGPLSLTVSGTDGQPVTISRTFLWTVVVPALGSATPPARGDGVDIWFDVASPTGADLVVTPAGDWKMTEGEEALRQSLLRRLITSPGEWQTRPEYGVGALDYVAAENTQASRDELANRIRAQFLLDTRVAKVTTVLVDMDDPSVLHVRIDYVTKLRAQSAAPSVLAVGLPRGSS